MSLMSWLSRVRKPQPPRKQIVYFVQEDLQNEFYAVIRITWFYDGEICDVFESSISRYDKEAVAEIPSIIRDALTHGADVSVVCVETADAVGLKPK
jgi:hypothetical protein